MSYTFERTTVKRYEVYHVMLNFMKYEVFARVRVDKPVCEMCDKSHKPEEFVHLALMKKHGNMLICGACADIG